MGIQSWMHSVAAKWQPRGGCSLKKKEVKGIGQKTVHGMPKENTHCPAHSAGTQGVVPITANIKATRHHWNASGKFLLLKKWYGKRHVQREKLVWHLNGVATVMSCVQQKKRKRKWEQPRNITIQKDNVTGPTKPAVWWPQRYFHLKKVAFYVVALLLWNSLPMEARLDTSLVNFWQAIEHAEPF